MEPTLMRFPMTIRRKLNSLPKGKPTNVGGTALAVRER